MASRLNEIMRTFSTIVCLISMFLNYSPTNGQKITFEGHVGCAAVPPGPPTRLKAHSGYEKVRLRWDSPRNNACVDEYVVDIKHVSDDRHIPYDFKPSMQTKGYSLEIKDLTNGEQYEFTVRALSHRFDYNGEASIVASPKRFCRKKRPGKVTNLRAVPGDGYVELCWDGVANDACVSEYKVRTRIHTEYYRHQYDYPEQISKGGCIVIDDLRNNMKYEFTVMAYGKHTGNGIPTYLVTSPKRQFYRPKPLHKGDEYEYYNVHDDIHHQHDSYDQEEWKPPKDIWKYHSISNSYPDCEASKRKLCLPMSCADQARAGNCAAPFMRHFDYDTNTITQFCAKYCPFPKDLPHGNESRFLFLDDYCCRKSKLAYKIKDILAKS